MRTTTIDFNGQGTTRVLYDTRPTGDLELRLVGTRAREVRHASMLYNVSREMAARMGTGVRVKRMPAGREPPGSKTRGLTVNQCADRDIARSEDRRGADSARIGCHPCWIILKLLH